MRLLIIFLSTILISCSQRTKEPLADISGDSTNGKGQVAVNSENEFSQFISMLPEIQLPFSLYCEKCCDHPTFDRENEIARKYTPEGSTLVGLIFINEKYAGVLTTYPADMIIPSVVIYDLAGKRINERNFLTGWCGRDHDYLKLQYFKINTDYTMSSIDTAYSFEMDSVNQEIIDTIKTEISAKDFYINAEGLIVEK